MSTPITATTIAKIAGVTVTAVGQWRRRDKSFPTPIDPTSRPFTFDQDEVLAWLAATGRPIDQEAATTGKLEIAIRQIIDQLRETPYADHSALPLTLFAAQRYLDDATGATPSVAETLAGELERVFSNDKIQNAYDQTNGLRAADILAYLDAYDFTSKNDAIHGSPQVVNDLLTTLAPDACTSIIDITCGSGGTLDTLHRRFPDAELAGNDIDESALAMAQARALVSGWKATWFQRDAMAPSVIPAASYDLVCAVPPWGMRHNKELLEAEPQRWPYGAPFRTDDTTWLQLVHHLLRDNGTGIVILPVNTLAKPASRAVLGKMTTDRSLQAVIELPGKLHYGTMISTVAIVISKNQTTRTNDVLFACVDDEHVTRGNGRQVTDIDAVHIASALQAHRSGEQVTSSPALTQVDRLDLIDDDKTYTPTYWIDQANVATPDDLQRDLDETASAIAPVSGLGNLLDSLVITPDHAPTIPASDLLSNVSVPISRGADRDKELQLGDICVSLKRATVCTVDGERPDKDYLQAFRCSTEDADPWFLAAVLTAALGSGSASEGSAVPRLNLKLVDVPALEIEQQRRLGVSYRKAVYRQRAAEQQAEAWNQMSTQLASVIASGLATSSHDD